MENQPNSITGVEQTPEPSAGAAELMTPDNAPGPEDNRPDTDDVPPSDVASDPTFGREAGPGGPDINPDDEAGL